VRCPGRRLGLVLELPECMTSSHADKNSAGHVDEAWERRTWFACAHKISAVVAICVAVLTCMGLHDLQR